MIERQQELIISQKKQLLDYETEKKDPNIIQVTELQKLAQLEAADKYQVLEFLVKELMGMRNDDLQRQSQLFTQPAYHPVTEQPRGREAQKHRRSSPN